jgi:hypothetical protein
VGATVVVAMEDVLNECATVGSTNSGRKEGMVNGRTKNRGSHYQLQPWYIIDHTNIRPSSVPPEDSFSLGSSRLFENSALAVLP